MDGVQAENGIIEGGENLYANSDFEYREDKRTANNFCCNKG